MISSTLEGETEAEIDFKIKEYMESYHPAGYGTTVRTKHRRADGKWIAVMSRGSTCD